MTDERYQQLIALTKPPYNIELYQVLMQAVQEATLCERSACVRLAKELSERNPSDKEAFELYSSSITARSNF